jgi:hypothetical protein
VVIFQAPNCPVAPPNLTIENAEFVYNPNFEGREENYNDPGQRYFNVRIPDNVLDAVTADNWNISWTKPSKSATPQQIAEHVSIPFLKVHIGFTYRPPFISVWEDGVETVLSVDKDRDTVKLVDALQFEKKDIVVRGRPWEGPAGCGIKAWLQTFIGVVEMDDIQRKYARMRNSDES